MIVKTNSNIFKILETMTKDYVPNTKKHFSVHCNELINKGITKYNKVIYIHDPFNILD